MDDDEGAYDLSVSVTASTCGNGTIDAFEACDDGGTATGDGCGASCHEEPGYNCDGAEPSGNSVATLALLKLAAITDRADFLKPAEATLRLFGSRMEKNPQALPYLLTVVLLAGFIGRAHAPQALGTPYVKER